MELILLTRYLDPVIMGGNQSSIRGIARLINIAPDPSGECWRGIVTQKDKEVGIAFRYHLNPKGWYVFDR